jgi:phage terminase large subunit-like protein
VISSLRFFSTLQWIDGRPLQIEPYRTDIFRKALDTYRSDGVPQYTLVLAGRGKKNNKTLDLILAGLFVLMCRDSPQGSDALIVANDKDQADQDLDLAKKLVRANSLVGDDGELEILADEIRRKDGKGAMKILPANNVIGQHGKTAAFLGFDEIHGYRDHALFEALAQDPTRYCLTWITSYDSIYDTPGYPLHDYKQIGVAGTDARMLFSWYSGDVCNDPAFADLEPELRANPSIASWPEGRGYLDQQRRRLPSSQFRRLHLNLPGAPAGAFFDQGIVERAIITGRQKLEPRDGIDFLAFCDMSGGSQDDATCGIAHWDGQKAVLDALISQGTPIPFNPRDAVVRFVDLCRKYNCRKIFGDSYAGMTFRHDFQDLGIEYVVCKQTRTDLYEGLEVMLNADQVELLDIAKLRRELATIVRKGASLNHMPGQHDDWVTSCAGALTLVNAALAPYSSADAWCEFARRDLANWVDRDDVRAPEPNFGFGFGEQPR